MNPALWLARTARRTPEAPALMKGQRIDADYAGFARAAASIAHALQRDYGVTRGERVAVLMPNCTDYLRALYGIWFAGGIAVPINAKLHPKEAAWIIGNADPKLVIAGDDMAEALGADVPVVTVGSDRFAAMAAVEPLAAPVRLDRDDPAWLFYTSGTTGRPKGVIITCGNLAAMALSYFVDVDTVRAEDAILYAAPMSHGAGLYNFMHVMRGSRHVVPESGGFDPGEILSLAPRLGDVSFFAAPTMVKRLVERARAEGCSGEGIKTIVYGGGPMYLSDIVEATEVMGARFVQIYGQGESPMTITALSRERIMDRDHPDWRCRLASVGTAQSVVEVEIRSGDELVLPGEVGEIVVRGASVMKGYWRNPEATAGTLRDGWLHTGDLGEMDADGFVTLHDRANDMIISGGSNIYPREVEEVLLAHASVAEVSVVGRPQPDWGEEVVAFVVLAKGQVLDEPALDALCLDSIARFKRPKAYIAVPELPKNNYGKVLKTDLRARFVEKA